MEHRDDIIKLLDNLGVEVHPKLVLQILDEAGYTIVRVPPDGEVAVSAEPKGPVGRILMRKSHAKAKDAS